MLKVDLSGAASFFDAVGPDYAAAAAAHRTLAEHAGAGAEFTGWLELPQRVKNGELKQIGAAGAAAAPAAGGRPAHLLRRQLHVSRRADALA